MAAMLAQQPAIAVDLEHHSFRSYVNIVALCFYVIDFKYRFLGFTVIILVFLLFIMKITVISFVSVFDADLDTNA